MANAANQAHVDTLNSLLRGELSAVETYQKAEQKFAGKPEITRLSAIRAEHQRAADRLREHVIKFGGEASTGSGTWGAFANTIAAAANLFGENSAMSALKQGEQHGIGSYEATLKKADLPAECRALVNELLPKCREHSAALDSLMANNK
ncbi:MAG: PA2169 family four-helix-bundle protein [Gemmataceae bacterium]|nr:PA2169 family four-helix-bundle protein [Gemmataceae bacterium]